VGNVFYRVERRVKREVIMTGSGNIKLENCLGLHPRPLVLWKGPVVGGSH